MRLFLVSFALSLVGCGGGVTAEHPLTLKMGMSRDQAIASLKTHEYCPEAGIPPARQETYPRCDRPGSEWGESWVTARYEDARLVEVRRYERYTEDGRALERWNQLVTDRAKISTESDEATRALRSRLLEPGTRSVKAFRVDAETIAGVYLLTPSPPEDASVLEALILVPTSPSATTSLAPRHLGTFEMQVERAFQRAATPQPPTALEQHLLRALETPPPPPRPVGDFPSACGYGRCERTQPVGFFE